MLSLLTAVPLVLALPAVQETPHTPPPVFRLLDWESARAAAEEEKRFLLLDAMTSWCGPCKIMDGTTWIDPSVVRWIDAHAVAVQLDMDENAALKTELGVTAFPTMVLFDPTGKEFDRIVGLRDPEAMLVWLEGARGGNTERERLVARVREVEADDAPRTAERIGLAGACASAGADEEAGRLVVWLWAREFEAADEESALLRWRGGPGPHLAEELAGRRPEVRAELTLLRDRHEASLARSETRGLRHDWIRLNRALGESARTLRWASEAAASADRHADLHAQSRLVFDPLVEAGLWATAGVALGNPLDRVRFLGENLGAYDVRPAAETKDAPKAIPAIPMGGMAPARKADVEAEPKGDAVPAIPMIPMGAAPGTAPASPSKDEHSVAEEVRARLTHELRREASRRYGALLAAGRVSEAEAVASALLGYTDGSEARAHLVSCALRAGCLEQRREVHLRWLEEVARVR